MPLNTLHIQNLDLIRVWGKVTRIVGLVIEGHCPHASIGSLCRLTPIDGGEDIFAEIVGFKDSKALLMPLVICGDSARAV
ncbi:hypothetical protein DGMP_13040 [Desulfomarina profundi]|uniref:ATPase F1/V1/A1 complex alpha/beta subunit N-terminal domain-containing protein n=1 Tax=Desulfomarina profundi TaxID=2772557 RepID=A0A8D5FSJ4_9BACT|nr:hypothetical protein [Desulfomarina profundi]BCL60611.1 hypothetical protein DGMP_13040 [Desulfomarina profundi]